MNEREEDDEFLAARWDPCLRDPRDALAAWCEDDAARKGAFTLDLDGDDDDDLA